MISRRTAISVAEVYSYNFSFSHRTNRGQYRGSSTSYGVEIDKLYDFLYSHDYAAWFCNLTKTTRDSGSSRETGTRKLKEFIMRLHTGESIAQATENWSWEQRQKLGQEQLKSLATDILNFWHSQEHGTASYAGDLSKAITKLKSNLELDGYKYQGTRLLFPETDVLDVKEEVGILEGLYTSLQLGNKATAFHHLGLSEEHYLASKWDDSISNSRKFLECALQEVAARHSLKMLSIALPEKTFSQPFLIRDYLEDKGLLEKKEKEALRTVYGLLSETGGHPYMAQNDQARLLRHLSLTFAQFVMLRLQGRLASTT